MNKNGPVIIIEDDDNDQQLLGEIFQKLAYPNGMQFSKRQKQHSLLFPATTSCLFDSFRYQHAQAKWIGT